MIFHELQKKDLLSGSKYKRVRSDNDHAKDHKNKSLKKKKIHIDEDEEEKKQTPEEKTRIQFEDVANYVKGKKEFLDAQQTVKNQLFKKWDMFLDKYNDTKTKPAIQDEIFSKFTLHSSEVVVVGDFRKNFYLEGKIGKTKFNFEGYDEGDSDSTQWSMSLNHGCLASFGVDESFIYGEEATEFIKQNKTLKLTPIKLVEILLQLQPWFFDSKTFNKFQQNAEIE